MMRLSDSAEDYIEVIYYILRRNKSVKVSQIAQYLNVKRSSVTRALRNLREKMMISYAKYKSVELTTQGTAYAKALLHRTHLAFSFLHFVLGLDVEKADSEALILRKRLTGEVLEKMQFFLSHYARANPHIHADCKHNQIRCMLCQLSDRQQHQMRNSDASLSGS